MAHPKSAPSAIRDRMSVPPPPSCAPAPTPPAPLTSGPPPLPAALAAPLAPPPAMPPSAPPLASWFDSVGPPQAHSAKLSAANAVARMGCLRSRRTNRNWDLIQPRLRDNGPALTGKHTLKLQQSASDWHGPLSCVRLLENVRAVAELAVALSALRRDPACVAAAAPPGAARPCKQSAAHGRLPRCAWLSCGWRLDFLGLVADRWRWPSAEIRRRSDRHASRTNRIEEPRGSRSATGEVEQRSVTPKPRASPRDLEQQGDAGSPQASCGTHGEAPSAGPRGDEPRRELHRRSHDAARRSLAALLRSREARARRWARLSNRSVTLKARRDSVRRPSGKVTPAGPTHPAAPMRRRPRDAPWARERPSLTVEREPRGDEPRAATAGQPTNAESPNRGGLGF